MAISDLFAPPDSRPHNLPTVPVPHINNGQLATAVAGSNIAFVKYWGNADEQLHIPMNGSISMTLDTAQTTTTVEFRDDLLADELIINKQQMGRTASQRVTAHLDHIRDLAGKRPFARVTSHNSFPMGAGIASSASGFAALTVAAARALNLNLSAIELSRLSRLGSGSAARSIAGGFVEWQPGSGHHDSYGAPIAPPHHWDLVDIVAIVSKAHKKVGSLHGHPLAHTSPFYQVRLQTIPSLLTQVKQAILSRDLPLLGEVIEAEAISLHVAAMTSTPSVLYWLPGTINVMQALRQWRQTGGPIGYFTMDAGPNVHVITERAMAPAMQEKMAALDGVMDTLVCGVGGGARLVGGENI